MNKDNAKDYLPLVQALAEGKTIQYVIRRSHNIWADMEETVFQMSPENYRIKPEPLEFEVWTNGEHSVCAGNFEFAHIPGYRKIKVREVL